MRIFLYLLLINLATYGFYWLDKRAARRGKPRVPEVWLIFLGFAGGTVAAFAAQRILRHKTRKLRFQLGFWAATLIQLWLLLMPPAPLAHLLARLVA